MINGALHSRRVTCCILSPNASLAFEVYHFIDRNEASSCEVLFLEPEGILVAAYTLLHGTYLTSNLELSTLNLSRALVSP
jgi:hypothetical protein